MNGQPGFTITADRIWTTMLTVIIGLIGFLVSDLKDTIDANSSNIQDNARKHAERKFIIEQSETRSLLVDTRLREVHSDIQTLKADVRHLARLLDRIYGIKPQGLPWARPENDDG